jgi:Ca2+/Na+ antiporter
MADEKELAVSMYHREHTRWNHWALFFFGSIVSLFVLYGHVRIILPLWVPLFICLILSIMWILVALNIRATTRSWEETIIGLGSNLNSGQAFQLFREHLEKFSRSEDLLDSLRFWSKEPYISVTRLLTLFGLFAAIFFLVLLLLAI